MKCSARDAQVGGELLAVSDCWQLPIDPLRVGEIKEGRWNVGLVGFYQRRGLVENSIRFDRLLQLGKFGRVFELPS